MFHRSDDVLFADDNDGVAEGFDHQWESIFWVLEEIAEAGGSYQRAAIDTCADAFDR